MNLGDSLHQPNPNSLADSYFADWLTKNKPLLMHYNKEERHDAYKLLKSFMMDRYERGFIHGFCYSLSILTGFTWIENDIGEEYPELIAKKPDPDLLYWYPCDEEGHQARMIILDKCIEETANNESEDY